VDLADTTRVTRVDVLVIVWVGLSAAIGFRRGLVGQALALGGFTLGALIGSRIGPHALSSGAREAWQPVAALIGAVTGGPVVPIGGVRSLPPPDSSLEVAPAVRRAEASVVRVEGTSCGLTLQGSGWVVRHDLVATNAHVLAGEHDTRVLLGSHSLSANPVYVNASTDVALLRVPGLDARVLAAASNPHSGTQVALVGYPGGGPRRAAAGTIGS